IVFADASKLRLAGNLPAWPAEVPDEPGTYGLVIGMADGSTMRVVASHVKLPGGYHLLMGRESVRFESLVGRFWYGLAGAIGIGVGPGCCFGMDDPPCISFYVPGNQPPCDGHRRRRSLPPSRNKRRIGRT